MRRMRSAWEVLLVLQRGALLDPLVFFVLEFRREINEGSAPDPVTDEPTNTPSAEFSSKSAFIRTLTSMAQSRPPPLDPIAPGSFDSIQIVTSVIACIHQ